MSVAELKERHMAATETVNSLRERLKQKRLLLLDTDGLILVVSNLFFVFLFGFMWSEFVDLMDFAVNLQWRDTQGHRGRVRWPLDRRIWCAAGRCRGIRGRLGFHFLFRTAKNCVLFAFCSGISSILLLKSKK